MDIDEVRRFLATLPGTTEEPHFELTSARVGGKIYATWPGNGARIHVFLDAEQTEAAVAAIGAERLLWGSKLAGVRVDLPADVRAILIEAWRRKAPKRVVAVWEAARL